MQIKDNRIDCAPRHNCKDQRTFQILVLTDLNKSSIAVLTAFTGGILHIYLMQGNVWTEMYSLFIRPSKIPGGYRQGVLHLCLSLTLSSSKLQTKSNCSEFKSNKSVNETFLEESDWYLRGRGMSPEGHLEKEGTERAK